MNKGTWYAIGAYALWGLLPVYWKALHAVPALQLMGHRVVWSCLALYVGTLLARRLKAFRIAILKPQVIRIYVIAAILIGINWLTYVWAVNANFIVETSLGYFINPLFSVLLGVVFFRERLRLWQWIPIGLAVVGVLYLTIAYGSLPWIALTLALSFGLYGLVKKMAPLGSLYGVMLETSILFLPAVGYLLYSNGIGQGAFLHTDALASILLIGAGPVTMIPLLMFSSAAQRIPLSLVGILQYIAPTLQLLLGVLVYGEDFTVERFIGFGIVWIALIIYGVDGMAAYHTRTAVAGIAD
ncbi:MAG: EamA family transporter RarD [Anaerolineae bacterium]|nr:EamA family transporter RarD [Anaerolineae bacterium]